MLPSLPLLAACLILPAWTAPVQQGRPAGADLTPYPWIYLRGGEPLATGEPVVELIVVGDVMLGRGVAGVPDPLSEVAPWLRAADLSLGNLECAIGDRGVPRPGPYRLQAEPAMARELAEAGFDIMDVANNHALDYGRPGLVETESHLVRAGIATVGFAEPSGQAPQSYYRHIGAVRIAFLAFNAVPDPEHSSEDQALACWDPGEVAASIASARARADAVVVSIHWGYENQLRVDPSQEAMARVCLAAGADLVVGHHPHVVQGIAVAPGNRLGLDGASRDGLVAYSLGNFVFDQAQGETRYGLALRAFFDREGLRAVQALPLLAGPRPRLMARDEAQRLLARVEPGIVERLPGPQQPDRRIAFACDAGICRLAPANPEQESGQFSSGQADLTGDGVPETVSLSDGRVVVSGGGAQAWQGLPEWRVVDLALGDADDDGRTEMVLALWKDDAGGVPRSHPFLVGFREGRYRVLWGGSAVVDPISEVEVGDVDGDGVQELVVLQELAEDTAVAVLRWHGWGFSLVWSSSPGRYRDLDLIWTDQDCPPLIGVVLDGWGPYP